MLLNKSYSFIIQPHILKGNTEREGIRGISVFDLVLMFNGMSLLSINSFNKTDAASYYMQA